MNRLGLIIQREYLQTVGKKSFIITTVLVPVLSILLCVVLPVMLAGVHSDELKSVAVIDQTPDQQYAALLHDTDDYHFIAIPASPETSVPDSMQSSFSSSSSSSPSSSFSSSSSSSPSSSSSSSSSSSFSSSSSDPRTLYTEGDYYAIVQIPADIDATLRLNVFSEQSVPSSLGRDIEHLLRPALRNTRIASYDIEGLGQIIQDCDVSLQVNSVKWGEDGQENISSSELSSVLGLVLALAIYMFVLMYGAMIMSGVVEEKTNRIVEVIISSCKPIELMLGKIIGVALVGFTQFAIWAILLGVGGTIVSSMFGLETMNPGALNPETLNPETLETLNSNNSAIAELFSMLLTINYPLILTCFILYFIGGYLLYASLFAAFGSAVDQQQDTSQFMAPIMFFMVFALYAGMFSMENPDGPLAWWCSMIPFTAPITMMVRLPFDVPVWELCLSLGLLFATAFLTLWLASRIYRTGILMYGKKFNWKDILKWIKQ